MKVLNILYQAYPYVSGSTVRFHDLNNEYRANTRDVHVYNLVLPFYNFQNQKKFQRDNLYYQYLSGPRNRAFIFLNMIIKLIYFPILVAQIIYMVRRISPDIVDVHAMTYSLPGVILSRLILRKDIKIVFNCRSVWHINTDTNISGILKKLILKLDRIIMKQADGIIFISEEVKSYYNIKDVRSIILGNRAAGSPLETYLGAPSFGYLGSILENEGIHLAIEAFKKYRAKGGIGEFRIWGSGYYLADLRIKYDNTPGLYFMGGFSPWQRREIYTGVSHVINFRLDTKLSQTVTPIKSLECIMHARQLIASNVDGIRKSIPKELYQFVNFVEAENINELANVLLKCDTADPTMQKRISLATLQRYNWSNNCKKQFDYYRSLLN